MLRSANDLTDFSIGATDGDIGRVEELCFDEKKWTVCTIVVNTGGWLRARKVLISPLSVERVDWKTRAMETALTRQEVKNSPTVNTLSQLSETAGNHRHERPSRNRLRSTREIGGYVLAASDGTIGHVDDFIIDDETWRIRYLVVDTRNWWPGKKVVISPRWIKRVNWKARRVEVELSRKQIKDSPEYDDSSVPNREYEERLYRHYGQTGYWNG